MHKLGMILAVLLMLTGISKCTGGGEPADNIYSRWQTYWDNSVPAANKLAICTGWDLTPSATALQFSEATGMPTMVSKQLLGDVC